MNERSRLDRDKARAWLEYQFGLPDLPDEIGDDELDSLEDCVLPDPRIARIEALLDEVNTAEIVPWFDGKIRAILRGDA